MEIALENDFSTMSLVTTQFMILLLKLMIDQYFPMNSQLLDYFFTIDRLPQSIFFQLNTLRFISQISIKITSNLNKGKSQALKLRSYNFFSNHCEGEQLSL